MKDRWKALFDAYNAAGLDKLLGPLLGQASDGDRRRRMLQLLHMLCSSTVSAGSTAPPTPRFQAVNDPTFPFACDVDPVTKFPVNIGDQDWLQCVLVWCYCSGCSNCCFTLSHVVL